MAREGLLTRIPAQYTQRRGEWPTDGVSITPAEYSHMIDLYGKINRTYQLLFPEVYVDPKVQKLDIYRRGSFLNGGFEAHGRVLKMDIGESSDESRLNANYSSGNPEYLMTVPRHIGELVVMSHEIGHAIFVQTVNGDNERYRGNSNGLVEFPALDEGFATTLGNMFIERIVTSPEIFDLSGDDREILIQYLAMRRSSATINNASWTYKDGIKIMDEIYNDDEYTVSGSGDPGLRRIKAVLEATDVNFVVDRFEEERRREKYQELLRSEDPRGATSRWIEFIKDRRQDQFDGDEIALGTFFDE